MGRRLHPLGGVARRAMRGAVALTGVPGTGKTTVAARLPRTLRTAEVGELALRWGAARKRRGGLIVDVDAVRRRFARSPPPADVVVGHLSHLLPVRDVVVLRCHPEELRARLERSRRLSERELKENYLAEALDVVLVESLGRGRRVWEVDTTGRSAASVARTVARIVRRRVSPRWGRVDWLADARVTEHLLDCLP